MHECWLVYVASSKIRNLLFFYTRRIIYFKVFRDLIDRLLARNKLEVLPCVSCHIPCDVYKSPHYFFLTSLAPGKSHKLQSYYDNTSSWPFQSDGHSLCFLKAQWHPTRKGTLS